MTASVGEGLTSVEAQVERNETRFKTSYEPAALYYQEADTLEYLRNDGPRFYRRIDERLTLALDMDTNDLIGFRIKGFRNFYLREIKPIHDKFEFVTLVSILERCFLEIGNDLFEEEAKSAYKQAARIALADGVVCTDLPQAA